MMTKQISFNLWSAISPTKSSALKNKQIDYLAGIEQNDSRVLKIIYNKFLGTTTNFVLKNNGNKDDAMDVFQDALVIIYKKIKTNNLILTAAFGTYLFSVCRFIWLRELRMKHRQEMPLPEHEPVASDVDIEKEWVDGEKRKLFQSKMKQLSSESQAVLKLFFNGMTMKEIASEMNYTPAYAQRKKYLAKNQLIALVKKDPIYQEFV